MFWTTGKKRFSGNADGDQSWASGPTYLGSLDIMSGMLPAEVQKRKGESDVTVYVHHSKSKIIHT